MKRRTRLIVAGAAVVIVGVVLALSLTPFPTTYNVNVSTQVVQVVIGTEHRAEWHFADALLYRGDMKRREPFAGTILVSPRTEIVFERTGNGPLHIRLRSESDSEPLARLAGRKTKPEFVFRRLVIVVPAKTLRSEEGYAVVLPMSGRVTLGAELAQYGGERPNLLLGGKIALLAHSLLSDQKFDAGTTELDIGDFVQIKEGANAHGLLLIGKNDINAVFRVVARRLDVYRFGAQGYAVYASALARIKNDTVLQLLWASGVFLLGGLLNWVRKAS